MCSEAHCVPIYVMLSNKSFIATNGINSPFKLTFNETAYTSQNFGILTTDNDIKHGTIGGQDNVHINPENPAIEFNLYVLGTDSMITIPKMAILKIDNDIWMSLLDIHNNLLYDSFKLTQIIG